MSFGDPVGLSGRRGHLPLVTVQVLLPEVRCQCGFDGTRHLPVAQQILQRRGSYRLSNKGLSISYTFLAYFGISRNNGLCLNTDLILIAHIDNPRELLITENLKAPSCMKFGRVYI